MKKYICPDCHEEFNEPTHDIDFGFRCPECRSPNYYENENNHNQKENTMALETLRNINEIDDYGVNHWDGDKSTISGKDAYILIDHEENTITFKIQNNPIKDAGVNGCQVDTIIKVAHDILQGLNETIPCPENEMAIALLRLAIGALELRKTNRESRGVEGTMQA